MVDLLKVLGTVILIIFIFGAFIVTLQDLWNINKDKDDNSYK